MSHLLRRHPGFYFICTIGLWVAVVAVALQLSCDRSPSPGRQAKVYSFTRFSMDTVVEYRVVARDRDQARQAVDAAHREIQRIDSLFWEENPSSPVYKWNHSPHGGMLPPEVAGLFRRSLRYSQLSNGAFDVTIKPVLDLYGFGQPGQVGRPAHPTPPSRSTIQERLPAVGWFRILPGNEGQFEKENPAVQVALGGVAKGYAVDRAIDVLRQHGIQQALINAGGDLYCLGSKRGRPWVVGIQHPRQPGAVVAVLQLQDRAVATSGDYQRFYVYQGNRYHHILDPQTGQPARKSQSATVIAPTTEQADAFATALFVLGARRGLAWIDQLEDVEGMVIDSSGVTHYSRNFQKFLLSR
ncbi:MAG: FAD:protein FMN transferase [Calditrichaeota bacterium]|nr:FAD:protein FMN transferase [Calditrichota bacterium]